MNDWLKTKTALLLDMNSTFMFGEDRFDASEDYSIQYSALGGQMPNGELNRIVRQAFDYLDARYPDPDYRECFPSVEQAVNAVTNATLSAAETELVVRTFAFHELGHIPKPFADALHRLHDRFTLATVIDIWAPKDAWLLAFREAGILDLFSAMSFSSDHGWVKPSPLPFHQVVAQLGVQPSQAFMVGDSARRDLGGAKNAGIDCLLVGGKESNDAVYCMDDLLSLLEFV